MELHTFSSLNETFLLEYHNSMDTADVAIVYFNPHTIAHKKLEEINEAQIITAFGSGKNLEVFTDIEQLKIRLSQIDTSKSNLLLMSSGTFDGLDYNGLAKKIYHL
jgi:UDP-N-acetylmuramate: L-alanyl-gamma-D-glutamyl-meso-diaminopimelate ligase